MHAVSLLSARSLVGLGLTGLVLCMALPRAGRAQPNEAAVTPGTGIVSIESDLQRADNLTGVITASGNVRIVYPDRRLVATARQAQFFSREGRVVLSGDVDVIQLEGPSIQAERITYLVDQERVIAEPASGEQVLSRFPVAPLRREEPEPAPAP
ncbi:MAG: LPS-assembly protein LptD [Prochlorococcaceae cyanobacterium]